MDIGGTEHGYVHCDFVVYWANRIFRTIEGLKFTCNLIWPGSMDIGGTHHAPSSRNFCTPAIFGGLLLPSNWLACHRIPCRQMDFQRLT